VQVQDVHGVANVAGNWVFTNRTRDEQIAIWPPGQGGFPRMLTSRHRGVAMAGDVKARIRRAMRIDKRMPPLFNRFVF
jgi:hypothetical protein